jgi:hypothetical protein
VVCFTQEMDGFTFVSIITFENCFAFKVSGMKMKGSRQSVHHRRLFTLYFRVHEFTKVMKILTCIGCTFSLFCSTVVGSSVSGLVGT